jgi:hypothetical protein
LDIDINNVLNDIPSYGRFLTVREIDQLVSSIVELPGIKQKIIGHTVENEPLKMLEIGKGKHTALIIGVPHSDEPLGSLVVTFFARWLAMHPEFKNFGWRWLFVPILERRGMRLNEGWFHIPDSFAAMAKSTFREPTEDQYEWTFPITYNDYQWTKSRPETLAIKNVLEQEKPSLLCGLHHSGFSNAYYYFSEDIPDVYPSLRKLAAGLRIPLSDYSPDVAFGRMLSPGFYQMYGLKDYLDYYKKNDPLMLPSIKRGACSDEWYQNEIGGFSFNCEVPMYLTPKLKDKTASAFSFNNILEKRYQRKNARVQYSIKFLKKIKQYGNMADPLLINLAEKHVENAKLSVQHDNRILETIKDKTITKAEEFENEVLNDLFDLFFLGQIWRVAESICIKGGTTKICQLMESSDIEIKALAKSIQELGRFYQVPIRTIVKMQLGSILIISNTLQDKKMTSN